MVGRNGVLIESDWNLKEDEAAKADQIQDVLIESDWNLKLFENHLRCPFWEY